jgi:hypothetical protein
LRRNVLLFCLKKEVNQLAIIRVVNTWIFIDNKDTGEKCQALHSASKGLFGSPQGRNKKVRSISVTKSLVTSVVRLIVTSLIF